MTSASAGKDAAAFRTIGEVADALKLPQHVLRFWETRFTQIRPMKRAGGRRFYRPQDVELVSAIRQLLYGEGYTIKGVQRILREQGPRAVAALAGGRKTAVAAAVDLAPSDLAPSDLAAAPEGAGDPVTMLRGALAELAACRQILADAQR